MRYMVASDLHGSVVFSRRLLQRFSEEGADKLILLGDLYYHGPRNPLTEGYNPAEVAAMLGGIKDQLVVVQGNCDSEVDMMISPFKFRKSYSLTVLGKRIFFTHGHKYNMTNPPADFDVLVYGHEHTGYIRSLGDKIFVNTGSVSLPKGGTPHSYVVIDPPQIVLKSLDGEKICDTAL